MEILITIIIALFGYLFTYYHKLKLKQREDKLKLIEKQINEFYGPLYMTVRSTEIMIAALYAKRKAMGMNFLDEDAPKSEKDISEWRIWVENIFMPLNEKILNLIIDKAHLIREKEVPECLLNFVAHVSGYRAIVKKWEKGDFSEAVSPFPYPRDLKEYAERSYLELKEEQLRLVGEVNRK
jgi:Fe-S cluster biosynthesis and repair protein YggX